MMFPTLPATVAPKIINLTIVECKYTGGGTADAYIVYNKSNHSGM